MDSLTPFNFLHSETILNLFQILAANIQKPLPPGSKATQAISHQVKTLAKNQDRWPKHVSEWFQARTIPVYSSADITKLSQSFAAYTESINNGRTALKRQFWEDITRLKESRDETIRQAFAAQERYDYEQNLYTHEMQVYQPGDREYQLLLAKKSTSYQSYKRASDRANDEELHLRQTIEHLDAEHQPIQLITT